MVDALKIIIAAYLLLLAFAAAWGIHRPLLVFPGRALYATLQLFLFIFSFGKVRLMPLARRAKRKSLRQAAQDFQEIQLEEVKGASWRKGNSEEDNL